MTEDYGCGRCASELEIIRTKVERPTDPTDIPHEIVAFRCPNCGNEFNTRSPAHPHRKQK
jgi:DNA-directed RNA polymerase subunit RPC12/RpoP